MVCLGAEVGKYLSHANREVWLQSGIQGEGELWRLLDQGDDLVALECVGGEQGMFLTHAFGIVGLQNGIQGDGERWIKITANPHK